MRNALLMTVRSKLSMELLRINRMAYESTFFKPSHLQLCRYYSFGDHLGVTPK